MIDCQEFHELMMDYRAASVPDAPEAYKRVIDYIDSRIIEECHAETNLYIDNNA